MEKFHFYLEDRMFNNNEKVFSTGNIVDGVYFIKSGTLKA